MFKRKYKFWWNNKEAIEVQKKMIFKLLPLNLLLFSFLLGKLEITEYLFIAFMSMLLMFSVIDLFKKFPNGFIADDMSEKEKIKVRLTQLAIGIIAWYCTTLPIWTKYYPKAKELPFAEHFMHPYGSLWEYISPPKNEFNNSN